MVIDKIGKFTVLDTLGSGAHSSILHVRREADSKEYALKLVSVESKEEMKFLEQAKHEFRVGQMLDNPNLVKVYAFETEGGWFSGPKKGKLLLEYVPGQTMDKLPLLRMAKLIRVFERIAEGLTHMHKQGIFHADMKPNNLIYDRGTRVKVIDFGLAWIKGEGKDRVQGTPEYMAPETVEHKLVSERTDIYNFGATMYRVLTGRFAQNSIPKPGEDKKLPAPNKVNPSISPQLSELISKCLNLDPSRRPPDMFGIRDQLSAVAKQMGLAEVDLRGADDDD